MVNFLGYDACEAEELYRRTTGACAEQLAKWLGSKWQSPKPDQDNRLRVFLSYARKDGRDIAKSVRFAMQEYGEVQVFMDEHDIKPGDQWRQRLADELSDGSAMLAIITDRYASRPWCREELLKFREPRQEPDMPSAWWATTSLCNYSPKPVAPPAQCLKWETRQLRIGTRQSLKC